MKQWRVWTALLCLAAPSAHGFDAVESAGVTLLFDWRGEFTVEEKAKLKEWQTQVVASMRLLHGDLPRDPMRVALQPYPASEPVPFAQVLRNEPQGIVFYVNPSLPLEAFVSDWTAYHEYTHLFIPYPGMRDIWFSEGLASYYQNVLQYRAGLLTGDRAREKLRAGFERGRNDSGAADMTLSQISREMRPRGAFMRVYWSGALYFLEADVRLRRAARQRGALAGDAHPASLDDVLRAFNNCCMDSQSRWNGRDIAVAFDAQLDEPLFVPLFDAYAATYAIPDYEQWLASPELDEVLGLQSVAADVE